MAKCGSALCLVMSFICYGAEPIRIQEKKEEIVSDEQILQKMYDAQFDNAQLLALVKKYPLLRQERLATDATVLQFVSLKNLPDFLAAGVPIDQVGNSGKTVLIKSAQYGLHQQAQALLEYKARIDSVDDNRHDALMYAFDTSYGGRVAEFLIQQPLFPSIINRTIENFSGKKTTYLHEALHKTYLWYLNHRRIVTALLQHGATVGVEELSCAAAKDGNTLIKDGNTLIEVLPYCSWQVLTEFDKDEARKKCLEVSSLEIISAHTQASDPKLQEILDVHMLPNLADIVREYMGLLLKKKVQ